MVTSHAEFRTHLTTYHLFYFRGMRLDQVGDERSKTVHFDGCVAAAVRASEGDSEAVHPGVVRPTHL